MDQGVAEQILQKIAEIREEGKETRQDIAEIRQNGEEIRRHFDGVAEGLRGDIRQVAEGLATVNDRLDGFRAEVKEEFVEVRAMIKLSYSELDRRLRTLETSVDSLETRVGRLESVG
jgi:chromosome segregation ATPase